MTFKLTAEWLAQQEYEVREAISQARESGRVETRRRCAEIARREIHDEYSGGDDEYLARVRAANLACQRIAATIERDGVIESISEEKVKS